MLSFQSHLHSLSLSVTGSLSPSLLLLSLSISTFPYLVLFSHFSSFLSPTVFPSFSLSLSLLLGFFFLVCAAMMPPHLASCMRNDKLGEPCFYLMGQNQTTVCSPLSSTVILSPRILHLPPDPLPPRRNLYAITLPYPPTRPPPLTCAVPSSHSYESIGCIVWQSQLHMACVKHARAPERQLNVAFVLLSFRVRDLLCQSSLLNTGFS